MKIFERVEEIIYLKGKESVIIGLIVAILCIILLVPLLCIFLLRALFRMAFSIKKKSSEVSQNLKDSELDKVKTIVVKD